MQVVDANVLLYAVNEDAAQHTSARAWLDEALTDGRPLGFSWAVILAFLRLSTRANVFPRPLPLATAAAVLDGWLARPGVLVLEPTARHLLVLQGLLAPVGTAGNLVGDAHLAALALEHAGEVVSYDSDFARFPGLRWSSPA